MNNRKINKNGKKELPEMSEQGINPDAQAAAEAFNAQQAGQAVTEAQNNPDYLQYHPNAVQDKAKAEEMAYASKDAEEQVIEHANAAMEFIQAVDKPYDEHETYTKVSKLTTLEPTQEKYVKWLSGQKEVSLTQAQEARNLANKQAQEAADVYDSINDESLTQTERVQALKRGKSLASLQGQTRKYEEPRRNQGFGSMM